MSGITDEQCFKCAVNMTLHHKEIKHHLKKISLLQHYEDQYSWKELGFPLAMQK